MTVRISILGSTGSIGRQTVDLLRRQDSPHQVAALTGFRNVQLLASQARSLKPAFVATADSCRLGELELELRGSGIKAAAGREAVIEAARMEADLCVAAIVGTAGLEPAVGALGRSKVLGLANKECLVAAGDLFMEQARERGTRIVSLDSEHSAIGRLLDAHGRENLRRIVLPASGGPFREWSLDEMARAKPEDAVRHPKWSMGDRISIDSASLFNKALEILEASHLFGLRSEMIDVLVHPQCLVHGIVEYENGQLYAQLAPPQMEIVIADALGWQLDPENHGSGRLDHADLARLDFEAPDPERFPALRLARLALRRGGLSGCVLNASHEKALDAFIQGRLGFLEMAKIVEQTMERMSNLASARRFEDVFWADKEARAVAGQIIGAEPVPPDQG